MLGPPATTPINTPRHASSQINDVSSFHAACPEPTLRPSFAIQTEVSRKLSCVTNDEVGAAEQRIFFELMTSDRKLKASIEGSN